jgi:hypothetical protein
LTDQFEISSTSIPDRFHRKHSLGVDDAINWKVLEEAEPQANVTPRCKLTPIQPTTDYPLSRSSYDGKEEKGFPKTKIEQLTQAPGGQPVLGTTEGQAQRPNQEKLKRQG